MFCSLTNYSRLVMFSFGFQQAFKRGFQPGDEIFFDKVWYNLVVNVRIQHLTASSIPLSVKNLQLLLSSASSIHWHQVVISALLQMVCSIHL